MTLLPVALIAAACGRGTTHPGNAMSADLQQDLKLAAAGNSLAPGASASLQLAPDEIQPNSKPLPMPTVKKAAGPRAVHSRTPTVRARPETEVAAAESETPQVMSTAAVPEPTTIQASAPDPTPASPRPVPVPAQTPGTAGAGDGGGSGLGAVLGGILGAVIRGGVVDGDHCDPRTDGRHGRRGGGIYLPNPGGRGGYPGGGVYGGGRSIPINPMVVVRGR